ncbi:SLATT domain-containing protein [Streptomyces sp. NPDC046900]|uniref:SLATT domain-containing protein n=1 Tax=Streptomyces sp. NPDC046900 TaxID=3155473 RepID=UPI0033C93092
MAQINISASKAPVMPEAQDSILDAYNLLFRWMEEESLKAYQWYVEEKRRKATASKVLRVLSIAGLTIGTVTPTVSILSGGAIPAESGYVVLGLAGGLLLLDKGFGFSSAWGRYMVSATKILSSLKRCQVRWSMLMADWRGEHREEAILIEEAREIITRLVVDLHETLEGETVEWLSEFHQNLEGVRAMVGDLPGRSIAT